MNKVKPSTPSATIRIAIVGAVALAIGLVAFNYDRMFSSRQTAPSTNASGPRSPAAGQPNVTSGQGTFRSSGSNVPQSLSGKPMSSAPTVVEGKVVDGTGQAVADVRVRCTNCKTAAATVLTDAAGHFQLPYLLESRDDKQPMELVVSKGDRINTYPVATGHTKELVLQLK